MSEKHNLQFKNYDKQWRITPLIYLGLVVCAACLFVNSQILYFSDSEIWGATSTLWRQNVIDPSRLTFNLINSAFMRLTADRLEGLTYLRTLYFLLALGSIKMLHSILKKIYDPNIALLTSLIAISHPFFLSHVSKVRADNLTLFFLLATAHSTTLYLSDQRPSPKRKLCAILTTFLLLSSSVKSIYWVIADGLTLLSIAKFLETDPKFAASARKLFLLKIVSLLILVSALLASSQSKNSLLGSYQFFMNSFQNQSFSIEKIPPYFSFTSLQYVLKWFVLSPIYTLASLIGLFLYFVTRHNSSVQFRTSSVYVILLAGFSLLFTVFHNHRLPFFIASYSFLLCAALPTVFRSLPTTRWTQIFIGLLVGSQLFSGLYYSYRQWDLNTNRAQIQYYKQWHDLLKDQTNFVVLDPISLFTPTSQPPLFLGPGMGDQSQEIRNYFKTYDPDLIFHSVRWEWYPKELRSLSKNHFYNLKSGVWRRSVTFDRITETSVIALPSLLENMTIPLALKKRSFLSVRNAPEQDTELPKVFLNFDQQEMRFHAKSPITSLTAVSHVSLSQPSTLTYLFDIEGDSASFRDLFNFDFMW